MKTAFTLIELLVVLVIITIIMGVVIPSGANMLHRYEKNLQKIKEKNKLSKAKTDAFLEVKNIDIIFDNKEYHITKKGIIFEKSNDNN